MHRLPRHRHQAGHAPHHRPGRRAEVAAEPCGNNLALLRTPWGQPRFEWQGARLIQRSMVEKDLCWEVVQTADVIDPHSIRATTAVRPWPRPCGWATERASCHVSGDLPAGGEECLAHCNKNMSCIACHSSWNPSCFGCHLPQKANKKMPLLHNEGDVTRNYTAYNFQTLRDDVYMLARDGDVTGNRIGPARSSCAVHVGCYNNNRESIYVQQQTISADGMSGIAFSTNVPHTVRGGPPQGSLPPGCTGSPLPAAAAPAKRRCAPTATSPSTTTTTPSWPSC